jgi:S-formylglutathione hydrolase FrmB
MGGYGAVKLALKYPNLFSSAHSHSGALDFARNYATRGDDWGREFKFIFGDTPAGSDNDCFALAEKLDVSERPALRIDCGVDDFLLDDNRAFHAHLETLGYTHEYGEFPGAHNWDYWDTHIREALSFHARNLGLKK